MFLAVSCLLWVLIALQTEEGRTREASTGNEMPPPRSNTLTLLTFQWAKQIIGLYLTSNGTGSVISYRLHCRQKAREIGYCWIALMPTTDLNNQWVIVLGIINRLMYWSNVSFLSSINVNLLSYGSVFGSSQVCVSKFKSVKWIQHLTFIPRYCK